MIDCSDCAYIYIHEYAWGEFWCEKLGKYIYDLHDLNKRFRVGCTHYKNKKSLNLDNKLRPLHGSIIIIYKYKEHPDWKETKGFFNTYEDFGEWLCNHFNEIEILNIGTE